MSNLKAKLNKVKQNAEHDKVEWNKQEAQRLFSDLETDLLVAAGKEETSVEFVYIGWPKEVLQELQKLLKKQGLIVELSNDNMLSISW